MRKIAKLITIYFLIIIAVIIIQTVILCMVFLPKEQVQTVTVEVEPIPGYQPVQIIETMEINPYGEPFEIECTAYDYGTVCKDGSTPIEGITVAGMEEWLGKTCIIYENNDGKIGQLIGIYEFRDTGGDYRLQNGTCIDIYMKDHEACIEWGRRDVFIQIVDGKG